MKERKKGGQNGIICSGFSLLHKRLGELRGQLYNTQVKLICLNRFGWTMLHVLRAFSLYPMYRLPFSISIYRVATALHDNYIIAIYILCDNTSDACSVLLVCLQTLLNFCLHTFVTIPIYPFFNSINYQFTFLTYSIIVSTYLMSLIFNVTIYILDEFNIQCLVTNEDHIFSGDLEISSWLRIYFLMKHHFLYYQYI